MNYQDRLNNLELAPEGLAPQEPTSGEPDHIYEPEARSQEISEDIHSAFSDGSLFGELIANSVGEALSKSIDKSGLDAYISDNIDDLKDTVSDAIYGSMNSDEFVHKFAETMAQKEVDREMQNLPETATKEDKEMEL